MNLLSQLVQRDLPVALAHIAISAKPNSEELARVHRIYSTMNMCDKLRYQAEMYARRASIRGERPATVREAANDL